MTARLAALLTVLALAAPAAALAQSSPFDPLPTAVPERTATPEPTVSPTDDGGDISTPLLLGLAGGLLLVFVVITFVITRDARSTVPDADRREALPRDAGPHRHERDATAKARAKAKASRQARKTTRKRAR